MITELVLDAPFAYITLQASTNYPPPQKEDVCHLYWLDGSSISLADETFATPIKQKRTLNQTS